MRPLVCVAAALLAGTSFAQGGAQAPGWEAPIEIAAGGGQRGPWRQNDSAYEFVDDPSVALDDRGEVGVVWVDQGRKDVLFQRFGPDGRARFGQPVDVSRTPRVFSWLPRVAFAPGDSRRVYVLWQEIVFSGGSHGGDILFARSEDGGATFEQPLNLSTSSAGDGKGRISREVWHNGSLDLAVADDGTIHAAWTEYEGALWHGRSTDGGRSFGPPRRVATGSTKPARGPSLAAGPAGRVYLAWTHGEDDAADIHLAASSDGGATFGSPSVAARTPGYSDAPKVAVDRRGIVHLVWGESEAGPFERQDVAYTRSAAGTLAFEPLRIISRRPGQPRESAAFPSLSLDGHGGVHVAWEISPSARTRPRGLGIVASVDGGRTFSRPQTVPASADPSAANGNTQGRLTRKLAVNREGAIALANSSFHPDSASRVWLMRRNAMGRPGGDPPGSRR